MWITMESHYMKDEEDIGKILFNNMNEFNNVFELKKKNILKSIKKTLPGEDLVLLNANLTSLQIKKTNSSKSLLRKNSKMYYVSCINIKNQKGECFSSLIDNLSENDRIVIINVVVLKQFTICNSNKLTVLVRSQDNSSVILFKCIDHVITKLLEKSNLPSNLSSLTGSGVYSIYGLVKKIIRYYDKGLISLRLLSPDKSSIKTLKYFHFNIGYQNIINNTTASGLNYDFLSNKVDILVETPTKDFTSLLPNQRICLNNVTVVNINGSDLFLLHMNGYANNIKVVPMEYGKTIKPTYLIPDEIRPKFKKLSDDVQLVSNDNFRELSTNITTLEKPLNVVQNKHKKIKCMDLSDDDDIVNLSPCGDFSTSTQINKNDNDVHNNANKYGKNKVNVIDDNSLPIKHLRSDDKVQKHNDNSSRLTPSNKDTSLPKSKICSQRDISPSASSNGSCSPSFFMSQPESSILNRNDNVQKYNDNSSLASSNKDASLHKSKIQRDILPSSSSDSSCSSSFTNSQPESFILNQDTRSNSFNSNIVSLPTQCIGPCRLIHTVPNIFDSSEIVSGFCSTCNMFIQKCFLKLTPRSSNNMEYKCPKCSTIVHLTFFFIMNFLYGKDESRAIEVCCYDKKAESVVRKISKKKITLEDYLSNQNNEQLVISSMKSLINNRTKVNIIVCHSPEDNKNILLGIDTKYVVTTTTQ